MGIWIPRQTLCDWTGWCSDQVEPVVKAMADYILSQPMVQSDETPVRMQLADGQMETARLWAYGLPWAEVVFDFRTDKSQKGPKEFLQGTAARFVRADGGNSYPPVFKELELLHIAYMAHIRRDIFEARDDAPLAVDLVLAAIQKLYRIEAHAKAKAMTLEGRLELRQREAKPIFIEVGQLIATMRKDVLPKSGCTHFVPPLHRTRRDGDRPSAVRTASRRCCGKAMRHTRPALRLSAPTASQWDPSCHLVVPIGRSRPSDTEGRGRAKPEATSQCSTCWVEALSCA